MLKCPSLPTFRRLQTTRGTSRSSIATCLPNRLGFATSRAVQVRQALTPRSRRIRNAGDQIAGLRHSKKKNHGRVKTSAKSWPLARWPGPASHSTYKDAPGLSIKRSSGANARTLQRPSEPRRKVILEKIGKQPVRTKYAWLAGWAPPLETSGKVQFERAHEQVSFQYDCQWTTRFHRIIEDRKNHNLGLSLSHPHFKRLVGNVVGVTAGTKSVYQTWMHMPSGIRLALWQDVMLWCLRKSPSRALKLLIASMRGRKLRPPRHVVGDCLQSLAMRLLHRFAKPHTRIVLSLYNVVERYVGGATREGHTQSVSDQVIYLLMQHLDDERLLSLLQMLARANVHLHANTLLQALQRTLKMGDVNLSLKLLQLVSQSGLDMRKDQVQSACVTLIRAQHDLEEPYSIQTKILTRILEMGVRPNIAFFNAILLNTIQAGYLDLAIKMFGIAKENRLAPDRITCRILLRGAVSSAGRGTCLAMIEEIARSTDLLRDHRVQSDMLNAIARSTAHPYNRMLDFYERHLDTAPLEDLGMSRVKIDARQSEDVSASERWPSPEILGQMICAYVRTHQDSVDLLDRYNRYHEFVSQQHPLIAPVAQTDHVSNAFLIAFGRRARTLPHCAMIMRHMLDDSRSRRISVQPEPVYPRLAAPSVQTWSILADAYSRHGQKKAAEKVLQLMQERNVAPNQVTWNSIISGLSSTQNPESAVDMLQRMRVAGFQPNHHTLCGLSKVYDRRRLLRALEEASRESGSLESEVLSPQSESTRALGGELRRTTIEHEARRSLKAMAARKHMTQTFRRLEREQRRNDIGHDVRYQPSAI